MTETAKERIYREALDEINNLAIDVAMDFEETGIDSVDCGKLMDIANKAFFAEANQQPVSTDKLSIEKLQEQLNTAKNALTESEKMYQKQMDRFLNSEMNESARSHCESQLKLLFPAHKAYEVLAAIGGDDD